MEEEEIKIVEDYELVHAVFEPAWYLVQLETELFIGHDIGAYKSMILSLFEVNLNRFIYTDDDISCMIDYDPFWGYWDLQDPLNFMISDPIGA
jgi:hypothetical protein